MKVRSLLVPMLGGLSLGWLSAVASGDVVVVDAGGGGDALDIHEGIQMADAGDVVLVRPGVYAMFVLDRGLSVVADGPGVEVRGLRLFVGSHTIVRDIPDGQTAVLRGLHFLPLQPDEACSDRALSVQDCAGQVWIEDCVLQGSKGCGGSCGHFAGNGAWLSSCDSVVFTRCVLRGGDGVLQYGSAGGHALRAILSRVALHDCELRGGDGPDIGLICDFFQGGDGVHAQACELLVSGGSATGGAGADPSGDGGAGVEIDAACHLQLRDAILGGGPGSSGGTDGLDLDDAGGAVEVFAEAHRSLQMPSPLREGQSATLDYAGAPGDFLGLYLAFSPRTTGVRSMQGWLILDFGSFLGPLILRPVNAPDGRLGLPLSVPPIPGGSTDLDVFLQAIVASPSGAVLSDGTGVSLLDSAF